MAFNEIKYRARVVKDYDDVPSITASEGRLSQVFLNLLINAAHAISEGNVEGNTIRIRTWSEREEACAEVKDTGKGIDASSLQHIFEPFYTTNKKTGTGLGLHIVYNLVTQKLNGTIECESEPGKGAVFAMKLPV